MNSIASLLLILVVACLGRAAILAEENQARTESLAELISHVAP